jgi:site-specific DNA recombinase
LSCSEARSEKQKTEGRPAERWFAIVPRSAAVHEEGYSTIVKRLNDEGIPGTRGRRWSKGSLQQLVNNERYLGRQIWGQQSVEHEPGTGRRIMRPNPRSTWHVVERPELRIISDDLWKRAHDARAELRAAVAPTGSLARRKSGKHHSAHVLSGFVKCGLCGGAITSVSGGKGSPRFGCRRSWQEAMSARIA